MSNLIRKKKLVDILLYSQSVRVHNRICTETSKPTNTKCSTKYGYCELKWYASKYKKHMYLAELQLNNGKNTQIKSNDCNLNQFSYMEIHYLLAAPNAFGGILPITFFFVGDSESIWYYTRTHEMTYISRITRRRTALSSCNSSDLQVGGSEKSHLMWRCEKITMKMSHQF